MSVFEIADERTSAFSERVDWNAPLPLGHCNGIARALELRNSGTFMSYSMIAVVMEQYHGLRRSPDWWRKHLIAAGAERRPHGNAFKAAA